MRRLLLAACVTAALTAPGPARAVVPLAPADNGTATSTPTFSWQLAPGEQAIALELSPNPAPGESGGFTDDMRRRTAILGATQTSFAVGNRTPLEPGTWFWHVNVFTQLDSLWTPVRRIVVPDEHIRLLTFTLTNLRCIRHLNVEFTYADNSPGAPARYLVEFRRRKRGRVVASLRGRADGGQFFKLLRVPRRVRRGRYLVRLKVRDAAGHVDRSGFRRIRAGGC